MCKDNSVTVAACSNSSLRLEVRKGAWRLAVPVVGGQPEVELSASAIWLQPQGSESGTAQPAVTLPVPMEAQPLDVENAKCSFSRKRGEVLIEWPQPVLGTSTSSDAETTASESEADGKAKSSTSEAANSEGESVDVSANDAAEILAETSTAVDTPPTEGEASEVVSADSASAAEGPSETKEVEAGVTQTAAAPEVPAVEEAAPEAEDSVDADEWKLRGNAAAKAGDVEEALRCYSAGLAVGGGDEAILCSNRALCFSKLGRHAEAVTDAKRCVALRPDFFKGYLRGAMGLRALGKPEEALAFLKKCPKHDEAATLAAELKPEAEAAEAARITALSGSERAKEEGNVLFRKGLFELAASKYSEALDACDDQESTMALAIRNNRAACYHQISDYSSVVRDTSYVLERDPCNFKALSRRMLALEPLERYEKALQDARAVLRQDPRNDLANKVQHRLGKLVRDIQRDTNA